jgi:OOP family OmpA-OmpF porin
MKRSVFIILVLTLGITAPSFAEDKLTGFSISPFIGGYVFEGDQDLNNKPVYGLRVGYDFTQNWGAELVFDYISTKYTEAGADESTNVFNYRLEGLYHFFPDKRIVPFLAIGAGGQTIDRSDSKTMAALDYGAGVKFYLSKALALRFDVRHELAFGSIEHNLEYTAGLSFFFGGPKKVEEPVVEQRKPEPAAAPQVIVASEMKETKAAPKAATEVERQLLEKKRVTLLVPFDFDKAIVKPEYSDDIKKVADVMQKYPNLNILIEGHTCTVGGKEYNLKLSQRRADAVKDFLVKKFGIAAERVASKGFGFSRPIADNKTKEGRAKNRRIEAAVDYEVKK